MNAHRWDDVGDGPFCDLCDLDQDEAGPECLLPAENPTGYQVLVHMSRGGNADWLDNDGQWVPAPPEAILAATTAHSDPQSRLRLMALRGAGVR